MKNRRTFAEARDELLNARGENCSAEEAEQQIIAELVDGIRNAEGVAIGAIRYEPISEALWHQAKEADRSSAPGSSLSRWSG